jgi:hypothetical protein
MGATVLGLVLTGWTLWYGHFIVGVLRSGVTTDRGSPISRKEQPTNFWIHIFIYGTAWLIGAAVSVLMFRVAWVGCPLSSTTRTCNPFQGIL